MFKIVAPPALLIGLLIYGIAGDRLIMGGQAAVHVDETVLAEARPILFHFVEPERETPTNASVVPLADPARPGEFLITLDEARPATSHDDLKKLAQAVIHVAYGSGQLVHYGVPDRIFVDAYGGDALCWEMGRITYFFYPYPGGTGHETSRIMVWRERTPWMNVWIF